MNNVTIGQYIPGNSWIYKLDPRIKIMLTFISMLVVFILPTILMISIALLIFILIILTTRIPVIKMIKGLKPILFLILFTFVLQVMYNSEGDLLATVNFQIGLYQILIIAAVILFYFFTSKYVPFKLIYLIATIFSIFFVQYIFRFDSFIINDYSLKIYSGGVERGLFILIRVILMISISSLLTFTTMSTDINNGLSALLKPLKLIKVPVGVISMMLSLTLRFIPTLIEETNKIMKAQASRGVDFSEGKFKEKITQIISLLVPIFVISFKKAEDLSNAMEARGYEIDGKRTQIDLLKFKFMDYFSLILMISVLGASIYAAIIN
ncbi:MAG: energy-coupling factor transporter transmembrane component T family protein [Anaeroplasmataceae bacterium]